MSEIRRNIVANFAGKGLTIAIALALPPFFARRLGMESYGLVGFLASLVAVLGFLDLGLMATLDREIARLSAADSDDGARATRDLVRTFEVLFWGVGAAAGGVVFLLAPAIARHWVNTQQLPVETVTFAVRVMGAIFAFQWPSGIYLAGLNGLQRQVAANVVSVAGATARNFGAAALILLYAPTVRGFFLWHLVATMLQCLVGRVLLQRTLPARGGPGRFRRDVLVKNWRFSAGMSSISLVVIALTQVDKILVMKLLALAEFGYYTLAQTVGRSLSYLIGPVFVAVYPRLCQLVTARDERGVRELYHRACQLMSVVVFPATLVLVLFPQELVLAWTGDPVKVARMWTIVVAFALGTALNGLLNIPYALQLAEGWTSLSFWLNLVALVLLVPTVTLLALAYGAPGAAFGWTALNLFNGVIGMHAMHRRLLAKPGGRWWSIGDDQRRWYLEDVGRPLAGALVGVLPFRLLFPGFLGRVGTFAYLALAGAAAVLAAAAVTPVVRQQALAYAARWRTRFP